MRKRNLLSICLVIMLILSTILPVSAKEINKDIPNGTEVVVGDVNFDNIVDIRDATMIQYYLAMLDNPSYTGEFISINEKNEEYLIGDVDSNNIINILDVSKIQFYLVKLLENSNIESVVGTKKPVIDVNAKQKYYDNYFKSKDFDVNGTTIKGISEGINIEMVKALDDTYKLCMSNDAVSTELFMLSDNHVYLHAFLPDEDTGEPVEYWWHAIMTPDEEDDGTLDMTDEMIFNVDSIEKVTYLKTENNVDYLEVITKNENLEGVDREVYYELEFSENGRTYTFTYVVQETEYGNSDMMLCDDEINYITDFEVDLTNLILVDEENNKTLPIKILSETETPKTIKNDVIVDANTHKVLSVKSHYLETSIIEYLPTVSTVEFEKPVNVEEATEDDIALYLIAIIFMLSGY